MSISEQEVQRRGQRLLARADFVIAAMGLICQWQAVVCSMGMGVVIVAVAFDIPRLGLAACLTALVVQVAHVALHVAARVVRRQLSGFRERQLSERARRTDTHGP